GRLNVDYELTKQLTFKPKINATYTSRDNRQHNIRDMYVNMPWDNPFTADGAVKNPQAGGIDWYGRDNINYLYDLQYNYAKSDAFDIQTNLDLEYRISDNFTV